MVPVKSHGNNAFYFRVVVTANNGNNIAGSHFARAQPLPPCSGETEVGPRGGESIKRVEGKTGGERALHRVCARRRRREAAISSVINNESSNGSSPLLALPLQPLSTPTISAHRVKNGRPRAETRRDLVERRYFRLRGARATDFLLVFFSRREQEHEAESSGLQAVYAIHEPRNN